LLAPPVGSLPPVRWARGPLSVSCRLGTSAYMLQAKTKGKVCAHTLPHATAVPETTSLLRDGSNTATCLRLQTPPFFLGGLRRCHMPRGSGPSLAIQEGSDAAMCPLASDLTSLLRRDLTLTCVLRHRTAPTLVVGSDADMCPMALYEPWVTEIEEDLATTTCSEARVFLKHTRTLSRRLQDV
jgi:hypothetical protein